MVPKFIFYWGLERFLLCKLKIKQNNSTYFKISLEIAIVIDGAQLMTNPLAKGKTAFSRNAMWILFGFFYLLSFSISKIVFISQKLYRCLLYSSGFPTELCGSHLILLSWNGLEKSAQKDWNKLVTWIKRGGGRCLGDFPPGVNTLGKFENRQLHWVSLNFPCRISIQYSFSMSYCL